MSYHNSYNCKKDHFNIAPAYSNIEPYSSMNCNRPVRRALEPVLVARIYNQPIVEEVPYSAMSFTVDNTATISNAYSGMRSVCDDPVWR